jgi:hypothetical protein
VAEKRLVPAMPQEPPEYHDYDDPGDDYCPNCGGEGWIACCFEEWACVDPESGCDECMRRCDWCTPRRAKLQESPDV